MKPAFYFRLAAGAIAVCAALGGCASSDTSAGAASPMAAPYKHPQSVWPRGALDNPGAQALAKDAAGHRLADPTALRRLAIGMTEQEVVAIAGEPASRGGQRSWQYLARGAQSPFAATLWFNHEGRLWMASTAVPPRAPASTGAPAPAATVIGASELFAFGSAELRAPVPELDRIARDFAGQPQGSRLLVQGFADQSGSPAVNDALSQRRADAVKRYLAGRGVPESQIDARGLGATQLAVDCKGVRDRAALIACGAPNRRVAIELTRG